MNISYGQKEHDEPWMWIDHVCGRELLAGELCLLAGCGHIHLWIIHLEGFQVCYNDALKPVKLQISHTGHSISQRVHLIPHTPLSHHSFSSRHQSILWRRTDRSPSLMSWHSESRVGPRAVGMERVKLITRRHTTPYIKTTSITLA